MYSWVSATLILQSIPYVNGYPSVLNVSFLNVSFFISHSLLHHLYLPYDLFLNESVFIAINNFLLLAMVNILTISRAGCKIAAWIDKRTIAASINEKILQNMMMDNTTGWVL